MAEQYTAEQAHAAVARGAGPRFLDLTKRTAVASGPIQVRRLRLVSTTTETMISDAEAQAIEAGPILAEHGYVAGWGLHVQNHDGGSGYGASVNLSANYMTDGVISSMQMVLPPKVAFALAKMLVALEAKIEARGHSTFSHGDDYGAFLDCTLCAPDRAPDINGLHAQPAARGGDSEPAPHMLSEVAYRIQKAADAAS